MVVLTLFLACGLVACLKEKEPEMPFDCATQEATYNKNVKPIINQYCVACHQQGGSGSFLRLSSYAEVKASAQTPVFLKSIKHEPGASAMPQGGNKLTPSQIQLIECWINQGFKE